MDDSWYDRPRNKTVELLSQLYDREADGYPKGFPLMTLGWSDGTTPLCDRQVAVLVSESLTHANLLVQVW